MMDRMHAIVIREPGGPEVLDWAEVPDPQAGPGEVVVDVVASAVNRADLLQRLGFYDPPPGTPPYPGLECSGRISALGEGVTGWRLGDEVCALLAGGGYAQKVAVPVGQLLPVPVGLVESAALPEVACTVWSNLVGVAHLRAGETVLIHGGGSGIGTFAIQFAKSLGARVVTTARPAKHPALLELGADQVIDYTEADFVAALDGHGGRHPRHPGRRLPVPQPRRAGHQRAAGGHRHAGRPHGRAGPGQADGQAGLGGGDRAAGPAAGREGGDRRGGTASRSGR